MVVVSGCGSSEVTTTLSAEERFKAAKALFDDGDYMESINEFKIVVLQYPGSEFADDAQYYMAEAYFQRTQYLLAAVEYEMLKRNMPASPLVADAQYKIGLCYYFLAPSSRLDQQYTRKAIDELQTYVEYHRGHEHAVEAEQKIRELTSRLAKKQYDTAKLYAIMQYYRASLMSFDVVIERYHDTEYAPLAYLGKAEVLISRNRYPEADAELKKFYERFPDSVLKSEADKLHKTVEEGLKHGAAEKASGSAGGGSARQDVASQRNMKEK